VPLKKDYSLCLEEYDKKLTELNEKNELPKLVFIPNPNNPTGSYISKTELKPFVEKWANREDLILVIDEAYNEFVSATDFCEGSEFLKFKNVVLLKTMSKVFGLAGLRLGFMIAAPELLGLVHRIRNPFNVNTLAQVAGACALSDAASIENIKKLIISGRDDLENFLKSSSIEYTPSQANFVFFDTKRDAVKVHDKLLSEGLILRPLIPYGFKSHLRITIGDVDQMSFAKNVLKKIIL
jgi:histidinol-phosphate aminotransferase